MKRILLSALMIISLEYAYANSDIYVCDNANGVKTYGNVGNNKGCKKVELPGLTIFPAPSGRKNLKAPGSFPVIDDVTQKNRDAERKQILDNELKAEQKKLSDLNAEYKNGEPDRLGNERNFAKYQERTEGLKQDINRTQKNIDALQREMSGDN